MTWEHIELHAQGVHGRNRHAYQDDIHAHTFITRNSITHPFNDINPMHLRGNGGSSTSAYVTNKHLLIGETNQGYKIIGAINRPGAQSMQNGSQIGFLVFKE